jgi:hypothetical protein
MHAELESSTTHMTRPDGTNHWCGASLQLVPRVVLPAVSAAGASLAPAAIGMRLGGVAAAWFLHLWFLQMVGIIGGLLAVSMCPLYPPEVRTTGMNFAHQVTRLQRLQQLHSKDNNCW